MLSDELKAAGIEEIARTASRLPGTDDPVPPPPPKPPKPPMPPPMPEDR